MGRFWPVERKKEWAFLVEGCLTLICLKVGTNRRHGWTGELGLVSGGSIIILPRVEVV